jgi:hypothetical protein
MTLAEVKHSVHVFWGAIEPYKNQLDLASVGLLLATLFSLIPHLTAVVTLVWSLVRLYETATVQNWLARRRQRKQEAT